MRHEGRNLAALNAADLEMVGSEYKNRGRRRFPEFGHIIGIAIENGPTNARRSSGASDLRQGRTANGLKDNGVGAMRLFSLNGFEKLGALRDGIVVGVDHLELDAELASGIFGGLRLFDLIVVVVGRQRDEKTQFFHAD